MTDDTIHTCSYSCERPGCIRAQRDYLAARLAASQQQEQAEPTSAPEPEVHSYDPTDQRESVTIRWPDGKCLGYVLDRTRYTDNLPPSAPVGVDFAAVASILRRAMRDGVHYGYRRDFILQQALALEALSQQPAAVDGPDAQAAEIEALRAEVERLRTDRDSWEQQASDRVADWHAEHLRAERLAEALRKLEERAQRDEALLRQALEALELRCGTHADERKELIPALREQLGRPVDRKRPDRSSLIQVCRKASRTVPVT